MAIAATRFTMVLASLFSALALGARAGKIRRQVVREAMSLTLAGLALGALLAIGLSRLLASILFGVGPADAATYAAATALLPAVALLASWLPTRRIASESPLSVLRVE